MSLKHAAYYHCFDPDPKRGTPTVREGETKTCQHCGVVRFIRQGGNEDVGGVCGHCWEFICEICVKIGSCDPIEEKFRRAEAMAKEQEERYGVILPFNPYRLPD
jgi:hypothetical protein